MIGSSVCSVNDNEMNSSAAEALLLMAEVAAKRRALREFASSAVSPVVLGQMERNKANEYAFASHLLVDKQKQFTTPPLRQTSSLGKETMRSNPTSLVRMQLTNKSIDASSSISSSSASLKKARNKLFLQRMRFNDEEAFKDSSSNETEGTNIKSHCKIDNDGIKNDTNKNSLLFKLQYLMAKSEMSQRKLQLYDKQNGLPKNHSPSMVNSSRSRKQLQTGEVLTTHISRIPITKVVPKKNTKNCQSFINIKGTPVKKAKTIKKKLTRSTTNKSPLHKFHTPLGSIFLGNNGREYGNMIQDAILKYDTNRAA